MKAGFLGAILAGLLAGYVVQLLKKIPVSKHFRPRHADSGHPRHFRCSNRRGDAEDLGVPIAILMSHADSALRAMGTGNTIVLALILGAMITFDMGGPINKTAFFFGAAMIREGMYQIIGTCAAAICTPPLGMGLATLLQKRLWSSEEREAGVAGSSWG